MFNKKSETESNIELWFLIIALSFGAILGIALLKGVTDRITGDDLRKKIIAGEVALIIDSAYAASQDFKYSYYLPEGKDFCVYVNSTESRVEVRTNKDYSEVPYANRIVKVNLTNPRDLILQVDAEHFSSIKCDSRCTQGQLLRYEITKDPVMHDDQGRLIQRKVKIRSYCDDP